MLEYFMASSSMLMHVNAFDAFRSQLKTLCLNEFPCGRGSWTDSYGVKKQELMIKHACSHQFCVTLKDYGAQFEKVEVLKDYINDKKSPWRIDQNWSSDAQELRQIAVQSPWLICDEFIWNHFKTVHLIDESITELDADFLKLQNLKELSLTSNYLTSVKAKHLPPKLQVLELCANRITSLEELSAQPPPTLLHLGLGYNQIDRTDKCITAQIWPQLLSLDLSHNDLTNLMEIVQALQTLPSLRNVTLVGNPLALTPAYRGYIVDSLKNLQYLDDVHISVDERHVFKGLSKKKEHILDEAELTIHVTTMQGVPMPDELKNPDDYPQYPIVTKTYFVRVMFLAPRSQRVEELPSDKPTDSDRPMEIDKPIDGDTPMDSDKHMDRVTPVPEFVITSANSTPPNEQTAVPRYSLSPDRESAADSEPERLPSAADGPRLTAVDSPKREWAELIELNWAETVIRDELLTLREFLKMGLDVMMMEQKVYSTPVETTPEPDLGGADGGKTSKTGKADKKGKEKAKENDKKGAKVGKKGGKEKKKRKEPEVEMTHSAPLLSVLAQFHVPTDCFIDGQFIYSTVLQHDDAMLSNRSRSPESNTSNRKLDKKQKGAATSKKDLKEGKGKEHGKPGAAGQKGAVKKDAKGKGKGGAQLGEEEEEEAAPLQIDFRLSLAHWQSVLDCDM